MLAKIYIIQSKLQPLTLSSLNLLLSFHPLQAANCCRNSRLSVDENDLQWVTNEKKILLLLRQFHANCRSETTSCRKLSNFSEMQDDAMRHREGLKG